MPENPSPTAWLWWLLPWLPAAVVILLLTPPFGEREQGVVPELLVPPSGEETAVAQMTRAVRWYAGTGFVLACTAGAAAIGSVALTWQRRLRTLDPNRASGFRALAYRRLALGVGLALAAGLAAGLAILACSPLSHRFAVWGGLPVSCALVSAGQSLTTLFGVRPLRRLFRGGLS